ncbi:hypothetical protein FDECE_2153 [Fusarium decemcellulare]|nr:hypothetical protein FDECE_2153 [Fusarium decemcellulare]
MDDNTTHDIIYLQLASIIIRFLVFGFLERHVRRSVSTKGSPKQRCDTGLFAVVPLRLLQEAVYLALVTILFLVASKSMGIDFNHIFIQEVVEETFLRRYGRRLSAYRQGYPAYEPLRFWPR